MKRSIAANAVLVAVLVGAAFAAQAQTDAQSLAQRWVEAYNKHDRAALGGVYTADAHLMMHGAPTVKGRQAITDFWAEDFKEGNPLTILDVTHSVQGSDMILVHGDYQVIDRNDGAKLGFGRFAHIWIKDTTGAWHLDRDLWNQQFEPYNHQ